MKYEQEKNKINKLWEKSQKNTEELNKKKNDSLKTSPNNFFKKSKSLITPSTEIKIPNYVGFWNGVIDLPIDGTLTCRCNYIDFKFNEQYINFILTRNDGATVNKRVICTYIEYEGWYYDISSDTDVQAIMDYDKSYTLIARPFMTSYNRWGNFGSPITFSTYEFFPIPPNTEYSYQLPSDSYRQTYVPNAVYSNQFNFSISLPPNPEWNYHLALSYPDLYYAAYDSNQCRWYTGVNHHISDYDTPIYFILSQGCVLIYVAHYGDPGWTYYGILYLGDASLDVLASTSGINVSVSASMPIISVPPGWDLVDYHVISPAQASVSINEFGTTSVIAYPGESNSDSHFFTPITKTYWVIFP